MLRVIMLDSSVLIDHFRAGAKRKTLYAEIAGDYDIVYISSIAKLEILYGVNRENRDYWESVFRTMRVLPFTEHEVEQAFEIIVELKRKRQLIDMEDMMIAATAMANNLPLATLNRKHFERIEGLELIE